MNFDFIFSREQNRIVPSVLIDARASISELTNQTGFVIKAYTDGQVALITGSCLFYRIETDKGNLAGYMTLQVNGMSASVLQLRLRPAFEQFINDIQIQIINFISGNAWQQDFLF